MIVHHCRLACCYVRGCCLKKLVQREAEAGLSLPQLGQPQEDVGGCLVSLPVVTLSEQLHGRHFSGLLEYLEDREYTNELHIRICTF